MLTNVRGKTARVLEEPFLCFAIFLNFSVCQTVEWCLVGVACREFANLANLANRFQPER